MYKYELLNGHYIIDIENKKYLLDTGCQESFCFKNNPSEVVIDNVKYTLSPNKLNPTQMKYTHMLVDTKFDGFIGMDIIKQTSLTIYKNGFIDFKAVDSEGMRLPLHTSLGYLFIDTSLGKYAIDTGAMFAYGTKELFSCVKPYTKCRDYNPSLGVLESDLYRLIIGVNNSATFINICNNAKVQNTYLAMIQCDAIGNLTTFFDDICVLDVNKMELILK